MTIQVQSDTLPQLFEDVAHQVFLHFINPADVGQALREKIAVEAKTPEALLSEWVVMLLELLRYNRMAVSQFKIDLNIDANQACSLKAEVLGELLDVQRHELKQDPATARCQKVRLEQKQEKYHAEIVLSA